ncbi:MAG: hypothetical protein AAFO02_14775, partial [Bacteroidota bacterium]
MNVFKPLGISLALIFSLSINAQNFSDALRYSNFDPIGTARFMGAGSALGPLGADFSVMSTNPAGLGWLRKSEFMISGGLYINSINSTLTGGGGNPLSETAVKFNIPNIGIVTSSRGGRGMETFNFAIGLNRIAEFHEEFFYQGFSNGSIVQRFEELANDSGLDDFESGLGFDTGALFTVDGQANPPYFSDLTDFPTANIDREEFVERQGKVDELSFGFSGNVRNKVLWGFSLAVPFMEFEERKSYREFDTTAEVPVFNNLAYNQTLIANGTGINLKLGVIYRAHQALRLSMAIHTPTYYQIDETFETNLTYDFTLPDEPSQALNAESPTGEFNYRLRTPWRFLGGVGTVFGKNGFLSGEIEYVNFGGNQFIFDGLNQIESELNQENEDNLTGAIRLRTGGEYVLNDFRLRAGFGLQQSAIEGDDTLYNTIILGAGVRKRGYFLDVAYRRSGNLTTYTPYLTADAPQSFVDNDIVRENFVLTLGFRW